MGGAGASLRGNTNVSQSPPLVVGGRGLPFGETQTSSRPWGGDWPWRQDPSPHHRSLGRGRQCLRLHRSWGRWRQDLHPCGEWQEAQTPWPGRQYTCPHQQSQGGLGHPSRAAGPLPNQWVLGGLRQDGVLLAVLCPGPGGVGLHRVRRDPWRDPRRMPLAGVSDRRPTPRLKRTSPLATPELVDVFLENTHALGWTGPGAKATASERTRPTSKRRPRTEKGELFPCPVVGCSGMYGARKKAFCFKCKEPGPGAWTCIGCDGISGGALDECP